MWRTVESLTKHFDFWRKINEQISSIMEVERQKTCFRKVQHCHHLLFVTGGVCGVLIWSVVNTAFLVTTLCQALSPLLYIFHLARKFNAIGQRYFVK